MANTKHGLQETTGMFEVKGVVTGVDKDNFFIEKKTKNGADMRLINFGLEIEPNKTIYISLNGMPREFAYFSAKDSDGKVVVEKVNWGSRHTFNKEGYSLIGLRMGLEKGEDGKNINKTMTEFDACKEIADKLKDGNSLFVRGKIEYSSYDTDNGKRRAVKFIPQQLSLCSKDIDFEDESFEVKADFNQQIVFMGIEKTGEEFTVAAKEITYSSVEDAEFVIRNNQLASMFKKNLKPYNAINVHGHISVTEKVEEVEDDDNWGEADPTKRVSAPTKREMLITGANGKSLDKDTFTKGKLEEAIAKLEQSSNAKNDWGSQSKVSQDDSEDEEW